MALKAEKYSERQGIVAYKDQAVKQKWGMLDPTLEEWFKIHGTTILFSSKDHLDTCDRELMKMM